MRVEALTRDFPRLYHMAEAGSWESIRQHGLLSTSALLDLYRYDGRARFAIEAEHRPESVRIARAGGGTAVVRDQKPMSDEGLRRCLQDGLTPADWYRLLNGFTFFWLSENRLLRLLNAKPYRNVAHDVLTVETAPLVEAYRDRIRLSPMNSGCTKPVPHRRGRGTFLPIEEYPYERWRRSRPAWDAVVELAVAGGVADVSKYVLTVERMRGDEKLSTVWERSPQSAR